MNEYKKMEKFEMINLMTNGETLELRYGAELSFKENDRCESPFRYKYQDAEMPISEAWGHECRVKDVPKIVPYTIDTFPFDRVGGTWVKRKDGDDIYHIESISGNCVNTADFRYTYISFLEFYTWRDGSPCGIVEGA